MKRILATLLLSSLPVIATAEIPATAKALPGATLFQTKTCFACHDFGKKLTGPDLKGLFTRRNEDWVRKWIKEPDTMAKTDPVGQQLLAEYKIPMPKTPLTDDELNKLIEFLKEASK